MEKLLQEILNKLDSLETEVKTGFEGVKTNFEGINKKLDTIYAQVAHNTEQEVRLNDVAIRVENLLRISFPGLIQNPQGFFRPIAMQEEPGF